MGEQTQRQAELYDSAIKRARHAETDAQAALARAKQLEADLTAAEAARETFACDSAKVSIKIFIIDFERWYIIEILA